MKPIPVSEADLLACAYGYDQVIIFARKVGPNGGEHVTTYGVNKSNKKVAAQIGDFLKYKIMGWPKNEE